ncbi:MAG: NADH-quinone oxidoreductase subunit N [Planctomycetales bacterium]
MSETFQLLLPQTILAGMACLFFLGGTFPVAPRRWGPLALLALVAAGGALCYSAGLGATGPRLSAVVQTPVSIGIQWVCLALGALLAMTAQGAQSTSRSAAEFYGMLLLVVAGVMLVAMAQDLILLFLALELISLPTYVLLYLGRNNHYSQEATTKYFLLSILSAAVLLYGFALIYGLTGNTRLDAIQEVLAATYQAPAGLPPTGGSVLGVVALVLVFAGLGFKVAAVPFHFYAPDVYEGTSAFNAGLLAIMPKLAGFVALIHVATRSLTGFETTGQQLALILAAITMTGGNCLALHQTNIRRLLAYSSIAHAGYILIGIAVAFWENWNPELRLNRAAGEGLMGLPGGVEASLLYLLAYSLTSVGLFAVLVYLHRPGKQVDHVDELTGLGYSHPLLASCMALFLFSLAGIPPLPGFWAKLSIFASALSVRQEIPGAVAAIHPAFLWLAVIGVVNAAIGGVYYLRLVSLMFLYQPLSVARPAGGRPALIAVFCSAAMVLGIGLAPRSIFEYLQRIPQRGDSQAAMTTLALPNGIDAAQGHE